MSVAPTFFGSLPDAPGGKPSRDFSVSSSTFIREQGKAQATGAVLHNEKQNTPFHQTGVKPGKEKAKNDTPNSLTAYLFYKAQLL